MNITPETIEIIKPNENSPVAKFFSLPNTPETDEQINGKPCTRFAIAAGDSLRDALVPSEFARKLERERDEARRHLEDIKEYGTEEINAAVELRQKLAAALLERDEALKEVEHWKDMYRTVSTF